jgi:hypothetical protein
MFGIGTQELGIIGSSTAILLILAGIMAAFRRKGNTAISGPTLVLKKFEIKKATVSDKDEIINIIGRAGGLISWFLTLIGLETEYYLKVTAREIRIKRSSLFGQYHDVAALTSVSSVHCGYLKPIGYLFIAILLIISGLFTWIIRDDGSVSHFLGGLILGSFFILLYWLLKKIQILVLTRSGYPIGLVFKRSVIENVPVDIEKAKLTVELINNLIVKSQGNEIDIKGAVSDASRAIENDLKNPGNSACKYCGSLIEEKDKFCQSCGRSIK